MVVRPSLSMMTLLSGLEGSATCWTLVISSCWGWEVGSGLPQHAFSFSLGNPALLIAKYRQCIIGGTLCETWYFVIIDVILNVTLFSVRSPVVSIHF